MIVVTGASRGLGYVVADRLNKAGKSVLGLARNVADLPFPSIACDVSSYDQVRSVATKLKSEKVKVDALINAAGVASMNLAVTTPAVTTEKVISINLMGTIYCCQLMAPLMLRYKEGRIINFSTIAVALGLRGESIYAASKAGVEGFSRAFAREMSDFNINVNCIAPGPIQTELLRGVSKVQIDNIVKQQIYNKQFTPDDVADLVDLLLAKESASLTGQVFHIGGV